MFVLFPLSSTSLLLLFSLALRIGFLVLIFYGLNRVTEHFEEKWGIVFMVIAIILILLNRYRKFIQKSCVCRTFVVIFVS